MIRIIKPTWYMYIGVHVCALNHWHYREAPIHVSLYIHKNNNIIKTQNLNIF